ncbi:uncharacterized protein [Dendropsophus ebraccatus]|uniref:uncharacterized protein n=1 Tax=Dendropsophus ebraccatus TaxID=150705 RepID=UPI0038310B24
MPNCVVHGCLPTRKKRDSSIILHGFPREPEKIKLWLQQTGQYDANLDDMVVKVYLGKVNDSYRMCSLHFTNDSYHYDGYRRTLKKTAIPTIFNTVTPSTVPSSVSSDIPSVSSPPCIFNEKPKPSVPAADSQKQSGAGTIRAYRVDFPVVDPEASSQPTIQQMSLVPVVPQQVFFQECGSSQKTDSVVGDRSSLPIQPITTDKQMHSLLSTNSNLTIDTQLTPEASFSSSKTASSTMNSCRNTSFSPASNPAISTSAFEKNLNDLPFTAVSGTQPCSLANVSSVTQTSPASSLEQKASPISVFRIPLKTSTSQTQPCSLANVSSVTETSPASSLEQKASPISVFRIPLKTSTSQTQPCSLANVSSVTETSPVSSLEQKASPISVFRIPLKTSQTSQTLISSCVPPSKKRKLERGSVSSSSPLILPKPCISQLSVTGNLYYLSNSIPLVQTSCLIQKPVMVDKGVNTDHLTNRKSCCVGTNVMYRRNVRTQTKIYTKDRKIMCTLSVARGETDKSSESDSSEDIELNDYSPSCSSDNDNDPCDDLDTVNLEFVKVEVLSDYEEATSVLAASDIKHEFHIKEENDSSVGQVGLSPIHFQSNFTIPDLDTSALKIEPTIKTEEDKFPISFSLQDTTFIFQSPKIERISPIPCDQFSSLCSNPTSWETSAIQTEDEPEELNDYSFHIGELSENEDESFLVPSDAEDEDDVKHVFQDLESPEENPIEEEKYIVFESCLKKLIMMIPCRAQIKCMSPLTQYRKETVGSYLSIEVRCSSGHTSLLWESQPRHGYEPLGNVLLSAAVLFSGSSFVKSQQMFKLLNLKSMDKTTYSKHQSMYLFPTINHHWKEEQKAVMQSIQGRPLCLAGDQQLDNPGFSAKYSTYSLMDVASKKICSFSVEPVTQQVTLEDLEKIGFLKAMEELKTINANVKMIVTGRSVAIKEILKESHPDIIHHIDLWHLSRSIGEEVLMAAKNKDCEILHQWVEAIRNHLWWSSCTCCKNPDLLIQKWKSIIQHVTNVHEWDGDSDCRACHHPPLPEDVVNSTNWLEKGSAAHEQLKNIVENPSLLEDLKQLSFHCHTGELEIYYRTCLKYCPKTLHFFMDSMVARTQLAVLDLNRNVHTVKTVVKDAASDAALGPMTQKLEISNSQKSWTMKALYKPACQSFLFDIMNDVIALVKKEKTF